MDSIQIRNVVLPQAENETNVTVNFNVTFSSGVTIKDGTVFISNEEYGNTLPKDMPALVAQKVADKFTAYKGA